MRGTISILLLLMSLIPLRLGAETPRAGAGPGGDKKAQVHELTMKALAAFRAKRYQQAIDLADKIREIRIPGELAYLDNARKIVLAARKRQKDHFEASLLEAMKKYTRGDYQGSLALCQGVLKEDPTYDDARRCAEKARQRLGRNVASPPSPRY